MQSFPLYDPPQGERLRVADRRDGYRAVPRPAINFIARAADDAVGVRSSELAGRDEVALASTSTPTTPSWRVGWWSPTTWLIARAGAPAAVSWACPATPSSAGCPTFPVGWRPTMLVVTVRRYRCPHRAESPSASGRIELGQLPVEHDVERGEHLVGVEQPVGADRVQGEAVGHGQRGVRGPTGRR